jgi:polar amino acid transport system ATP-binding protein
MTADGATFRLEATGVWKSYGDNLILKGVSINVAPGEVVALIGPSGAGKSTFLRCVNHLETIDRGLIRLDGELIGYRLEGRRLNVLSGRQLSAQRARIGMVFQSFNLFRHMTAVENVAFAPRKVRKRSRGDAHTEAIQLLARMGLQGKEASYPNELSGGQQQRVAIARALAMEPRLILMDEPTSALDPELSGEVVEVIRSLAEEGRTMVVATHDLELVRSIAQRIIFMVGGEVVEEGDAAKVLDAPQHQRTRTFLSTVRGATVAPGS